MYVFKKKEITSLLYYKHKINNCSFGRLQFRFEYNYFLHYYLSFNYIYLRITKIGIEGAVTHAKLEFHEMNNV